MKFTHQERRSILEEIQSLATDADLTSEPLHSFLPLSQYQAALEPRRIVICGERGSGKTAFFHFLSALQEKKISILKIFPTLSLSPESLWLTGFSEKGTVHPSPQGLELLSQSSAPDELRYFWLGHLVGLLFREPSLPASLKARKLEPFYEAWSQQPNHPKHWLRAARESSNELLAFLDELEASLEASSQHLFVLYDHLDRIAVYAPEIRLQFVNYLLQLWLSFSNRYKYLRAKIFLRPDLFQASLHGTDASKLEARKSSLNYTEEDLYRILWRHFLAFSHLRQLFEKTRFQPTPFLPLGFFPPKQLFSSDLIEFTSLFSEKSIGSGATKGSTYRWITNHLQDAKGNAVPRSFLNLFAFAAEIALKRSPERTSEPLLPPATLQDSLQKTSKSRVLEIQEEFPVVRRLESLRGLSLFANKKDVIERLSSPLSAQGSLPDDGFKKDGEAVFEELVRLGICKLRKGDVVDLPEIYRLGLEMKRVLTTLPSQNEPRFA